MDGYPSWSRRGGLLLAMLAASLIGAPALADPATLAASCSGCHAADPAIATAVPPLFGRPEADTLEALRAFRAGTRPATVMDRLVKGYSDEELAALAAYFARETTGLR